MHAYYMRTSEVATRRLWTERDDRGCRSPDHDEIGCITSSLSPPKLTGSTASHGSLIYKPLSGRLAGDPERDANSGPAAAMDPGTANRLRQPRLVGDDRVCGGSNRPKVVGVVRLHGSR